jgi:hypothetical protein
LRQPNRALSTARFSSRAHPFPAFLLAVVALAVGAWAVLELVRARRLEELGVGGAKWIWVSRSSPVSEPVHFSAIRRFELRAAPRAAQARIFVDRRFQLWVNGSRAAEGGQAPGGTLARVDVGPLLKSGSNVVAIVAESTSGIGGILFSLDTGAGTSAVVSDGSWTVDATGLEISSPARTRATVLGTPPMHPWLWPRSR